MFKNRDGWFVNLHEIKDASDTGITVDDGWSLFVDFTDKPPIDPGDVGVFYSTYDGLGGETKGLFVNGIWYIPYQTKEESEARRQQWLEDYEAKKLKDYEDNIDKWLATKESLREPLRNRIQRFEDQRSDFWQDMGSYELFCCEQADRLLDWAEYLVSIGAESVEQAIDTWANLPYDEQAKMPGFNEGHSGNTFDGMVALARRVATGIDI